MSVSLSVALLLLFGSTGGSATLQDQSLAPISDPAPMGEEEIALARQTLDDEMADWPSARFRNVRALRRDGEIRFCGEVNARNRMGGMTGWQTFFLQPGGPQAPMDTGSMADLRCIGVDRRGKGTPLAG